MATNEKLNQILEEYDQEFFGKLEPVLDEIRAQSKGLASNLKDCIIQLAKSDRYQRAADGKTVAIKEKELTGEEFEIFRKYVRLLRSCTIICSQGCSGRFKELFLDFFSGTRLEIALKASGNNHEPSQNQEKETST
ncbi:MAG: hypothetical protein OXU45_03800 [Candidatus Melainabacteria bacterium]|nr:hypothetical protein [Candidatus Melainabacteria bacterium]